MEIHVENPKKALIDLPVLLIFFARPHTFGCVFEKIREARPSILFLACDGPRPNNEKDVGNIELCKQIAANIDWKCTVYQKYSEVNLGCGMGPSTAINWAFEYVDRLLILEDDCVPDVSIFHYMNDLLEKYKDDERVGVISGYNHFRKWNCGEYDYFFTKTGATLGWGTWKRVWEKYDYYMSDFGNPYYRKLVEQESLYLGVPKHRVDIWQNTRERLLRGENISWWDYQFGFVKYLNSYLTIVPKENLIYNIGVGEGSSHATHLRQRKWRVGDVCFMPTGKIPDVIRHPEHVICDRTYDEAYFRCIAHQRFLKKVINKIKRKLGK